MRRMRWAAVVAAITVAVAPAASAASPTTYTVTASTSSWVDLTMSRAAVLDVSASVVTAAGAYRGLYVQRLGGRPDEGIGVLHVAGLQHPPGRRFVIPLGDSATVGEATRDGVIRRRLAPGRYRVHVFAEGPITARLVLRGGGASRSVRASAPSKVTTSWRELLPTVAGSPVQPAVATGEVPVAVRSANSLTFVAMFMKYRSVGTFVGGTYNACLGPVEGAGRCQVGGPAADGPPPAYFYTDIEQRLTYPVLLDAATLFVGYYKTGTAVAGQRHANFHVALGAVLDQVTVGAFTLAY